MYQLNNTGTRELCSNRRSNQAVSLRQSTLFRWAVPVAPKAFGAPFLRPLANKKKSSKKNGSSFFCSLRSQSPHVPYLRSLGLLHPQYRFIPLRSASYAPLHSSSIMYAAPSSFSGCSFAQPSRRRPSVALNQGKPPKNGG